MTHNHFTKKFLILPVLLVIFVMIGCQNNSQKHTENQEKAFTEIPQQQQNMGSIDTSDWQTYTNEEFGFKMKLPGDINKYTLVIEKDIPAVKGGSIARLDIRYKLDHKILRTSEQPELGYLEDMTVWYIDIVPRAEYKEDFCKINNFSHCRQGDVLGKNDTYVFLSGFSNIEGAGYLCTQKTENQKDFCYVDRFFGKENIKQLIHFEIVK